MHRKPKTSWDSILLWICFTVVVWIEPVIAPRYACTLIPNAYPPATLFSQVSPWAGAWPFPPEAADRCGHTYTTQDGQEGQLSNLDQALGKIMPLHYGWVCWDPEARWLVQGQELNSSQAYPQPPPSQKAVVRMLAPTQSQLPASPSFPPFLLPRKP